MLKKINKAVKWFIIDTSILIAGVFAFKLYENAIFISRVLCFCIGFSFCIWLGDYANFIKWLEKKRKKEI